MFRKSALFLVGLHWGIYWVLWAQLTTLWLFKFWLSYSLDIVVWKDIAYNEKFVNLHMQVSIFRAFGPTLTMDTPIGDLVTE